mgnify:FL=1
MGVFGTWVYFLTCLAVFGYLAYLFWRYGRAR